MQAAAFTYRMLSCGGEECGMLELCHSKLGTNAQARPRGAFMHCNSGIIEPQLLSQKGRDSVL